MIEEAILEEPTPGLATGAEWAMVVVDTETTGLANTDKIVQLAARAIYADGSGTEDAFNAFIHPGHDGLQKLQWSQRHGSPCKITAQQLVGKPTFPAVGRSFLEFLSSTGAERIIIVSHNGPFDKRMLDNAFAAGRHPAELLNVYKNAIWVCSGQLAQRIRERQGKDHKHWALETVRTSVVGNASN